MIAALGGGTDRPALDRLLGATDPGPVDRAIEALTGQALVLAEPDGRLWLTPAVRFAWASPLRLGPPLAVLVGSLSTDDLKFLCGRLGGPVPARKAEAAATLLALLRDERLVRSIVDEAPDEFREVLLKVAAGGVRVTEYAYYGTRDGDDRSPVRWAVSRGLLMRSAEWANEFVMPAEVALALRGPDYTAPFDPAPPPCPRVAAEPDVVARDATAAAIAFLRLATSVLEEASRSRIPTLRTGGVGVRELKRLAKAHGASTDQLRLVLGTAHGAELLTTRMDGVTPTAGYDSWLAAEPAERLAQLVRAWWSLAAMPTLVVVSAPAAGRTPPGVPDRPWVPADTDTSAIGLRVAATRLVADGAPADWSTFADLVCWHHPHVRRGERAALVRAVHAWRDEAAMLGVLGAGTAQRRRPSTHRSRRRHRLAEALRRGGLRGAHRASAGRPDRRRHGHPGGGTVHCARCHGRPGVGRRRVDLAVQPGQHPRRPGCRAHRRRAAGRPGRGRGGHRPADAGVPDPATSPGATARSGPVRSPAACAVTTPRCWPRWPPTAGCAASPRACWRRPSWPARSRWPIRWPPSARPGTPRSRRARTGCPCSGRPSCGGRSVSGGRSPGRPRRSRRISAGSSPPWWPSRTRPEPDRMPLDPDLLWPYQLDAPATPPTRDVGYRPPWQPRRW